tara:strand:+ start:108 stop:344 length:237 start_codon:yes stop_codon:yes gene_type:complete
MGESESQNISENNADVFWGLITEEGAPDGSAEDSEFINLTRLAQIQRALKLSANLSWLNTVRADWQEPLGGPGLERFF